MLPQYERLDATKPAIQIPFGRFAVAAVLLPLLSFLFCVVWSVLFFFDESTSTHCQVFNFLPSISSAIGHYQPQKFVWQTAICLDIIPRFIVVFMYRRFYEEIIVRSRRPFAYFVCLLTGIENCALVGLSLWTSSDSYELHKFFFVVFILTSELYMMSSYALNRTSRKMTTFSKVEHTSLLSKKILFFINLTAFVTALYFFARHNSYCEPGVYSIFALFEYIVVLTNMAFHMTAYWDFYGKNLIFDWYKGIHLIHA